MEYFAQFTEKWLRELANEEISKLENEQISKWMKISQNLQPTTYNLQPITYNL